ncbi:MAG: polyketide cyclase [Bacteroidales bacterium]|jgi:carbon monoxide dehydrogenase subunit G|nr:polyketide cyclase [Bacteroidales bacterium]MDD4672419.1 polyketide cyclase [Bacteroidales bacterium]MDY0347307.1 polyketide cyclase [Tenuifilaceae bacterium]
MTTVESKIVKIQRIDEDVYKLLSDFQNFTPFAQAAKLENWQAGDDWCEFDVQGIKNAGLKIVEKEPSKTIKFTGNERVPFEFFVWIQLKMVAPYDTRMRITVKAKLNMMMKMMVKGKLQNGVDSIAEQIAAAFNGKP